MGVIKLFYLGLNVTILAIRIKCLGVDFSNHLGKLLLIDSHMIWLVGLCSCQLLAIAIEIFAKHRQLEVILVLLQLQEKFFWNF